MNNTQWVIWDLGGVVIDLNFKGMMNEASERFGIFTSDLLPLTREEFKTTQSQYSLTEKAVAGLITKDMYCSSLKEALNDKLSEREIEDLLHKILVGENQKTISLIRHLERKGIRHACMSNVDQIHWERISTFPSINDLFEKKFLSFEQKKVKPHAEAFSGILEMLKCEKEQCVFIDDREDNIQGAKSFGIDAILFDGHINLYKALYERALLPSDVIQGTQL